MASRKPLAQRRLHHQLSEFLRANGVETGPVGAFPERVRSTMRGPTQRPQPASTTPRELEPVQDSDITAPNDDPTELVSHETPSLPSDVPGSYVSEPNTSAAGRGTSGIPEAGPNTRGDSHAPSRSNSLDDREDTPPDPVGDNGEDEDTLVIHLSDLRTTQQFLDMLKSATLEDSGMHVEDLDNLRNPGLDQDIADPSPLLRSLRHFINNAYSSRKHYDTIRNIERLHTPEDPMLSFDQAKRRVRWLSGVVPVEHDMCFKSCLAYTGPYSTLDACPRCSEPRYCAGTTKPRKQFTTIPIGPVIQAFYSARDISDHMHYLERKLAENLERARLNGGRLDVYDDTACGQELLDAWSRGDFKQFDIALQFSIDGAQLRADRPSEAWFFIWVFHNLPPDLRYKKAFVIPGAIVPGPNKPSDIDSFIFPSFQHIAALQREGLRVYDASLGTVVHSSPLVIFGTADSLGNAAMSGMVGHSGRYGCRLNCDMPSRRRGGDSHYYPAMNRPDGYSVDGCCHPDITDSDLGRYRGDLPRKYKENLAFLLASRTQAEFRSRRLAVGLCKQTVFSGMPRQPLAVPDVFMMDIMHLSVLNDPDLFVKLFTGKIDVYEPDDRSTWDWAVFYQNAALWNAHGETVSRAVPYIPSSFGRAPRDPAKKINSGYKAWEFQQYMYGLCPTLLRHILPEKYWRNFCKLVAGIRILQRHRILYSDLMTGHRLLLEFAHEFEDLYYQRMESRIHFVRQSVHMLTHIGPETFRAGPLACYAQWTLETAIGNLGREVRQDRDMFSNLTQRAILRAQINSLKARFPSIRLEVGNDDIPMHAREFEEFDGYRFLPRCEEYPSLLGDDEREALLEYWRAQRWPNEGSWTHAVCRWARLQLPNGQCARSVWKESSGLTSLRRSSCVEISYAGELRIANVLFYFYLRFGDHRHPLAMVHLFSMPDVGILSDSSGTVALCDPLTGREGVAVVSISSIHSVVAMFPETRVDQSGYISTTGKFSLMRHAYIELAQFAPDGFSGEEDDPDTGPSD